MRALVLASCTALALTAAAGITGCSSETTNISQLRVGDCLKLDGTPDRPQATKSACGSPAANYRVVAVAADRPQCPTDLDPPVSVDQCASGLGYTYAQRRFAVCVEDVGGKPG